jgi:hypothetical protein
VRPERLRKFKKITSSGIEPNINKTEDVEISELYVLLPSRNHEIHKNERRLYRFLFSLLASSERGRICMSDSCVYFSLHIGILVYIRLYLAPNYCLLPDRSC